MRARFTATPSLRLLVLGSASALALLALAAVPTVSAQVVFWQGADGGSWDVGTNWDTGLVPQDGEHTFLTHTDATQQTVTFQNPANTNPLGSLVIEGTNGAAMRLEHSQSFELSSGQVVVGHSGIGELSLQGTSTTTVTSLVLGLSATGNGLLEINTYAGGGDNATLTINGDLIVGHDGVGHVEHGITDTLNPGITITGSIIVGFNQTGVGSYHLFDNTGSASAATFVDDLIVGDAGTGTFSNDGATHDVVGDLKLGNQSTGKGSYFLVNGGTTNVTGATIVGVAGQGRFLNDNSTHNTDTLIIGQDLGSSGHYRLVGGDTVVAGDTFVGQSGTGTVTHESGTLTTGGLYLGGSEGNGTYNLSGGTLNANSATIGDLFDGVGVFNHSGGTFNVTNELALGHAGAGAFNAEGYYNLSGTGVLNAADVTVSIFGYGEFNQSGGTANVTNTLRIGHAEATGGTPPREGHYNLSGGELNTGTTVVGGGESGFLAGPGPLGFFDQTGGTHNVAGVLVIGQFGLNFGGNGTYTMSGASSVLDVGTAIIIGQGDNVGSIGVFSQSDGAVLTNDLTVGEGQGATGTYNLTGGTLTVAGITVVGVDGTGTFNHDGGTHQTGFLDVGFFGLNPGTGTYNLVSGNLIVDNNMVLGNDLGDNGTMNQSSGSVQVNSAGFGLFINNGAYNLMDGTLSVVNSSFVGDVVSGEFNQTGGSHIVGNDLILGNTSGVVGTYNLGGAASILNVADTISLGNVASSTGVFNQTDGTVTGMSMLVGASGTGTYTQDGGSVDLAGGLGLVVASGPGSTGNYELNGGTLTTNQSSVGFADQGSFTQQGGTHTASALILGGNGGKGTYTLTDGILNTTVTTIEGVDLAHEGLFQQTGGTHTTNNLEIAVGNAEFGRYELSGTGVLNVSATVYVGFGGTGVFNQTDGTVTSNTTIVGLGTLSNGTYNQSGGLHEPGQLTIGQLAGAVGIYNMTGGILNDSAVIGDAGTGTFNLSAGNHNVVGDLTLGNQSTGDGTYNLSGTGALDVTGNVFVGKDGAGHYNQSGGTATVGNQVTVVSGTGTGEINLSGGSLQAASLVNNDTVNYTGGSLTADVTNLGAFNLSGAGIRTVTGQFINAPGGTVKVTDTTAVYTGLFTNLGTYTSDPAFNIFEAGLTIGSDGVMIGGAGDVFEIRDDFLNASTQASAWDTDAASLRLVLDDPSVGHQFEWSLAGVDAGQNAIGLADNFSFFDVFVDIALDDTLLISDGNGGGAAFYSRVFLIDLMELAQITSDFNVYYDGTLAQNAYLGCQAHDFGGGSGQLLAYNPNACNGGPGPGPGVDEPNTLPLFAAALLLLFAAPAFRRRAV